MYTILPSRPQPNRNLLQLSMHFYKLSFRKVFGLALLLSFIVFIPRLIEKIAGINLFQVNEVSLLRILMLIIDLASVLVFISILWRVYHLIHKRKESVRADIKIGFKKLISAFIAALLQAVALVFVVCFLFTIEYYLVKYNMLFHDSVLGILFTIFIFVGQIFLVLYTYTLFIFLVPIVALENKGVLFSVKRSITLVWNHWWRTFSLQIIPWLCFVLALVAFRFVFGIDVNIYLLENSNQSVWGTLLQLLIFALFIPWFATTILVQLRDLELRKKITQKDKNAIH